MPKKPGSKYGISIEASVASSDCPLTLSTASVFSSAQKPLDLARANGLEKIAKFLKLAISVTHKLSVKGAFT
jgi:hypothetical protein